MTENTPLGEAPHLRIFVVEDDRDTSRQLRRYLEKQGHKVAAAASVEEALRGLEYDSYDVLLSDIGLPDGDGWALLEQAHLPTSVCTIAMSGFGTETDKLRSRGAGYQHHLVKPFNLQTLNSLLNEHSLTCASHNSDLARAS